MKPFKLIILISSTWREALKRQFHKHGSYRAYRNFSPGSWVCGTMSTNQIRESIDFQTGQPRTDYSSENAPTEIRTTGLRSVFEGFTLLPLIETVLRWWPYNCRRLVKDDRHSCAEICSCPSLTGRDVANAVHFLDPRLWPLLRNLSTNSSYHYAERGLWIRTFFNNMRSNSARIGCCYERAHSPLPLSIGLKVSRLGSGWFLGLSMSVDMNFALRFFM